MNEKLKILMAAERLTEQSVFYRFTLPKYLEIQEGSKYLLMANDQATEMVEDIYGNGHLIMAKYVGSGLAFTRVVEEEFRSDDGILVEVSLSNILEQNGLIYPDRSTYTMNSFFFTMPKGGVEVKKSEQ